MTTRFRNCLFLAAIAAAPTLAFAQRATKPDLPTRELKAALHDEMRSLARQIQELRAQSAPQAWIDELSDRYDAIRTSLGGDDPAQLAEPNRRSAGGGIPHAMAVPPACGGTVTTNSYAGTGGPINPPQVPNATFTTVVSGAGSYLWDLNLTTFLTHTSCADLDITLESPAGTVVTITTDNGGTNDNVFNGTVWDENVNVPCVDYVYANLVTATPLNSEGRLAAFRGENPNGTWKLRVLDDTTANTGTLSSWSLDISTLAAAPAEATTTQSRTPGLAILDNTTLTDTQSFGGLGTYLDKVVVYLEITHTYAADLDITLTSPAGTVVQLTTDNGGSNDNVFNGTTFDADALNPVTDYVFTNLVTATLLAPEGSLDNFLGQDPNGTWTLSVGDDATADTGTLVRWDLSLTTTSAPSPAGPFNYAGTTGAIPDSGVPVVVPTLYTVNVAGAGNSLWDVDLTTFITHTACADLDMTLTSPAGTVVTISTDNGGTLDDVFNGTLWDDNANVPCVDYTYVNATPASPLSPEGRLATFRGENPNGTWTLTIADDALADNGTLGSWSLGLSTLASAPTLVSNTFSQSPNLVIPATAPPNIVSDVMPISGLGTSLAEVELYIEVPHTFAGDLDITLTSPAGTVVQVTTDNGAGNDNVFNGTLFDAGVTDTVTDHVYTNLVVATPLAPEGSFDNFVGQDPNGNWTLTVSDDANLDGGTFVRWDLTLRTCVAGPGTAYCDPGAGGVGPCPCGNAPAGPGQGCANSLGAGASINGSGVASLGADTVVLGATGIRSAGASCAGNSPSLTCILLQGNVNSPGGVAFNDGVRCFGGSLKRLQTATSVGGVFTSTVGISATSATLGDPIVAGTSRYYGVWYRDACASWGCPAPANSNVSNSYAVLWNP